MLTVSWSLFVTYLFVGAHPPLMGGLQDFLVSGALDFPWILFLVKWIQNMPAIETTLKFCLYRLRGLLSQAVLSPREF